MGNAVEVRWLGRCEYEEIARAQRERREQVLSSVASEIVWLLEHERVVTLGRRGGDVAGVEASGIPVVQTERGGLATYHGPGQLVGYFIVDLQARGWKTKYFVSGIERGIVSWLATIGIVGETICGRPGVFVGGAKVASIGLHIRKGVSIHGFSLNCSVDLEPFSRFTACGVKGAKVTSILNEKGLTVEPSSVGHGVVKKIFFEIDALHR
jgi:lipoyl(octanoyl) transferase